MGYTPGRRERNKRNFLMYTAALAIVCGFFALRYRQYAYAVTWHTLHGNYAELGGHKAKLPLLWWPVKAEAYDTSAVIRACPATAIVQPAISANPAIPGEVQSTNDLELENTKRFIALRNQDPATRPPLTLVTLQSGDMTLYCWKESIAPLGTPLHTTLTCHSASSKYTFNYSGSPSLEIEAEVILSGMK